MKLTINDTAKDEKIDEYQENIIKEIIEKVPETDYEKALEENPTLEKVIMLSSICQNLINWYPFKKGASALEIGANFGELTGFLCDNLQVIVAIEPSKIKAQAISKRYLKKDNLRIVSDIASNIKIEEKFDYVLIHNIENQEENIEKLLEIAENCLKDDGTIFLAVPNSLSIKRLNCVDISTQNYDENNQYSKKQIETILQEMKKYFYKFYYPLPDEKTPNVIFTDEHLPSNESVLRDLTLYKKDEFVKTDERTIYRNLLKENPELFTTFANSFLVEISKKPIENTIKYVTFGNSRKPEYRLKTVMEKDFVYKTATQEKAQKHIERIQKNIEILKNSNIYLLDSSENNVVCSKLIKEQKSFDKELLQLAKQFGTQKIIEPIKSFERELLEKLEKSEQTEQTVFDKYEIECKNKENLHFIKYGIFDLIFQNCFVIDNKFYFYDQEWIEENVPIEFILYRAIYYLGNSERKIDVKMLYKELRS